jgi:hypothetical protein
MDKFEFRLHYPSTSAEAPEDLRFAEWVVPIHQREGKPVKVWHTQGLNLIGVPSGLIQCLGVSRIKKASVFPSLHSTHIETNEGFYMLRIHSTSRLVFPEGVKL